MTDLMFSGSLAPTPDEPWLAHANGAQWSGVVKYIGITKEYTIQIDKKDVCAACTLALVRMLCKLGLAWPIFCDRFAENTYFSPTCRTRAKSPDTDRKNVREVERPKERGQSDRRHPPNSGPDLAAGGAPPHHSSSLPSRPVLFDISSLPSTAHVAHNSFMDGDPQPTANLSKSAGGRVQITRHMRRLAVENGRKRGRPLAVP